jgi:hypothetical protein
MSSDLDTTRIVRSWLEEGVTKLPDRVLDAVLDELVATPQVRPRLRPPMPIGLLIAATILLAVLGGAITLGARIGDASRNSTPGPSPTLSVRAFMPLPSGPMEAGSYVVDGALPVDIAFEVPDGWFKARSDPGLVAIKLRSAETADPPDGGVQLGFSVVDNLFADPCLPEGPMLEPPVGPSVEDLAEAFATVPAYQVSVPTPVSVDGHVGLRLDLDVLLYMCPPSEAELWRTPAGSIRVAGGEEELLTVWILDVDGERIVITEGSLPWRTEDDMEALHAVFETIELSAEGD